MTAPTNSWYVVQTQPNAERKAVFNLKRQGYETYLPQYLRRRRHARRVEHIKSPLFPRYLFVAIDMASQRWRSIQSTIGVSRLICNGDMPAPVPTHVVEQLRALFMVRRPDLINEQWLMLPHCIADREFVPLNTVLKHWDVIVPGASYHFRRRVKDYLATCKDARLASLDGFLQRFLYWATTDYRAQRIVDLTGWAHRRFRERIAASRIAVTCDGSIGYALRKFFEIPAFGTLLVARFFPGMHALGFRDGENCFAIRDDSLDRLAEIIDFAKSDSCEVKKIVRAGQEMVREFHSAQVRARQLLALLEALCNKKLAGTRWQDGQQIILAPSVKAAS